MLAQNITIPVSSVTLQGILAIPNAPKGLVVFVHGSGSGRLSKRNQYVAQILNQGGIATLLFDLLSEEEEIIDNTTREYRFDIPLLTSRLIEVTNWIVQESKCSNLNIAYFGASTGAAAAIIASVQTKHQIKSIVSRGGRIDLAEHFLKLTKAPILAIVGRLDSTVLDLNLKALGAMECIHHLQIIEGATHLFEENNCLQQVAISAKQWFLKYFNASESTWP